MVAAIIKVDIENNYYKCSGKLYSCTVSRKSKTAANQNFRCFYFEIEQHF